MVDPSAKGKEGRPFPLDVERGKVRELARALQAHDLTAHTDGECPVAPPTFLAVQLHWETFVDGASPWEHVKMSQERGMHAEQEYVVHGPPLRAGERLMGRSRIDDVWTKESRTAGTLTFVRMVTEFRDVQGNLRAEAILTGVETGKPPEAP